MIPVKLIRIGYFMAKDGGKIKGKEIPSGRELVEVITSGIVLFDPGNGVKEYGPGSIFRHQGGDRTVDTFVPGHPYHCLTLLFELSGVRRFPRISYWRRPETLSSFCRDMLRSSSSLESESEIIGDYAYSILNWCCWKEHRPTSEMPQTLQRALEFIKKNFDSNISIDDMAEAAGVSRPYFQNLFKRHLALSPHNYLLELRMQRAGDLLAASDMPIKEISLECGFENIESFYRTFRKHCNTTPAEYRLSHSPQNWK